MAATLNGFDTIVERTLDGLVTVTADVVETTTLEVNGQTVSLGDLFNKVTDNSDDIVEGVANLFLTPAERADIAANTAARHAAVTLGTPTGGLALGGTSGQELTLATASATQTGALDAADWAVFAAKQDALTTSAPLTLVGNNLAMPQASSTQDGYLSAIDFAAFSTGGAWTVNTTPTPDVVHTSNTANNVAIGATTVPTAATRLYVNGTAQANDLYVTGTATVDSGLYVGPLGVITAETTQLAGGLRVEGNTTVDAGELRVGTSGGYVRGRLGVGYNAVPGAYQFDVSGGGRFTGQLDVQNGLTVRTLPAAATYGIQNLANLSTGQSLLSLIGKDTGLRNAFWNWYNHGGGDNSTSNNLRWDVNGYNNILFLRADGAVGLSTNAPGAHLDVDRSIDGENGGRFRNSSTGANAFSSVRVSSGGSADFIIFKNSSGRTADGGAHTTTIRNDQGNLRLQAQGSLGMTIGANTGIVTHANGDNSYTMYGPNSSWNSYLYVGATPDKTQNNRAQVISTDGNLHLDSGRNNSMYLNYYSSGQPIRTYGPLYMYDTLVAIPFRHIFCTYRYSPPVQYPGPTWTNVNFFSYTIYPKTTSSFIHIRVSLSVAFYGDSSIGFRITRNGVAYYTNGTSATYSGHARTAPCANSPYWMPPPMVMEIIDTPGTTGAVTYAVQCLTYSTGYGFRLNYPSIGGSGGDATGVISWMSITEYQNGEYVGWI